MISLSSFQLIDTQMASKILGVSEKTVIRYIDRGLPHFKFQKEYRYLVKDIVKFKKKK